MKENIFYVYIYYIKKTNEIFYVGKGSKNRFSFKTKRNELFKEILNNNECEVKILVDGLEEKQAYDLEYNLCIELKSLGMAKANIDYGTKRSEQTIIKLSETKLGNKNPMYGVKQSKETIEKRRKKLIGHKVSEETRKKIGLSNGKKVKQIDKQTFKIIKIFDSCSLAEKEMNLSKDKIARVCRGERKTAKGFIWEFV